MSEQEKKGWFRKAVDEYNKFCKELGLDKSACRGFMPRIEFDDDGHLKKDKQLEQDKKKEKTGLNQPCFFIQIIIEK